VSGATIRKNYDVSSSTLRSWAEQGKVKVVRSQGGKGKRLYCLDDFKHQVGLFEEAQPRRRICYARVSSAHQHADLERQCDDLRRAYPEHELLQDTGSGLNWKRPGLLALLDAVCGGTVAEIVVAHRDRLARIGVELLEWLFERYDTRLVVLDNVDERQSETDELRDDLLAVVTFFVARNNGRRSAANRKRRRDAAQQEDQDQEKPRQAKRRKSAKDPSVPQPQTEGAVIEEHLQSKSQPLYPCQKLSFFCLF
jgi:putative resolvase